jgi:hypothetical protein
MSEIPYWNIIDKILFIIISVHLFQSSKCQNFQIHDFFIQSFAVLWQHTAKFITMYFYWLVLQKCNFSQAQYKLPEDGPGGLKHVGANVIYFNVNFNILYV